MQVIFYPSAIGSEKGESRIQQVSAAFALHAICAHVWTLPGDGLSVTGCRSQ